MLAIITKASDDYWYKFKEITNIKDLLKIHRRVVVEKNDLGTDLIPFWEGFKYADIPLLEKAECHITIYDDYLE